MNYIYSELKSQLATAEEWAGKSSSTATVVVDNTSKLISVEVVPNKTLTSLNNYTRAKGDSNFILLVTQSEGKEVATEWIEVDSLYAKLDSLTEGWTTLRDSIVALDKSVDARLEAVPSDDEFNQLREDVKALQDHEADQVAILEKVDEKLEDLASRVADLELSAPSGDGESSIALSNHLNNRDNPHEVTAEQVGLGLLVNAIQDTEVTEKSDNYITSGAVWSALQSLKEADEVNQRALSDLVEAYTAKVTELTDADKANEEALAQINSTYEAGIEELAQVDSANKQALDELTSRVGALEAASGGSAPSGVYLSEFQSPEIINTGSGESNTYTIKTTDESTSYSFTVYNGEKGQGAGFGAISVNYDDIAGTGDPEVSAEWSGEDTAKNLTLTFKNLKGEKGEKGEDGTGEAASLTADTLSSLLEESASITSKVSGSKLKLELESNLKSKYDGYGDKINKVEEASLSLSGRVSGLEGADYQTASQVTSSINQAVKGLTLGFSDTKKVTYNVGGYKVGEEISGETPLIEVIQKLLFGEVQIEEPTIASPANTPLIINGVEQDLESSYFNSKTTTDSNGNLIGQLDVMGYGSIDCEGYMVALNSSTINQLTLQNGLELAGVMYYDDLAGWSVFGSKADSIEELFTASGDGRYTLTKMGEQASTVLEAGRQCIVVVKTK